ncbi:hypothetical protein TNCV_778581 [Trichonephila clavipes]|nr:hypothetical protein TNCV_778581 [Trichonephila clavipes]
MMRDLRGLLKINGPQFKDLWLNALKGMLKKLESLISHPGKRRNPVSEELTTVVASNHSNSSTYATPIYASLELGIFKSHRFVFCLSVTQFDYSEKSLNAVSKKHCVHIPFFSLTETQAESVPELDEIGNVMEEVADIVSIEERVRYFTFKTGIRLRRKSPSFPEDTTMPYSGFESDSTLGMVILSEKDRFLNRFES